MMFEKHQQFGGEFGCLSSFSFFFGKEVVMFKQKTIHVE